MKFDYRKRYSIEECLKHPFINIKPPEVQKIHINQGVKLVDCLINDTLVEKNNENVYVTNDNNYVYGRDMLYILNDLLQSH